MDSRTAAHTLAQIAEYMELNGESRFKSRAYQQAARAVQALDADDLRPLLGSGELEHVHGLGPGSLAVIRDLCRSGESSLLDRLRESTPEGLLEMLRIPGLGPAKIHAIHEGLDIDSVQALEEAARDGRLAALPKFGPKTAEKILKGIAFLRESDALVLFPHAAAEAMRLLAAVRAHPDVRHAEIAGELRRRREVIRSIVIVAECGGTPAQVGSSFAHAPGVKSVVGGGARQLQIRYVDGTLLDLRCVSRDEFPVALWRATGSEDHAAAIGARIAALGFSLDGDTLRDAQGAIVTLADEAAFYARLGLPWIAPELREGLGEVEAANDGRLPRLVEVADIRGVLHAHSQFSDGESTIAEMSEAAMARGWSYFGVTDHSQSAFYAGGLSREAIQRQHAEIDELNAQFGRRFRVLKGIEADILPCGRVDYDGQTLDQFDYVIGSVHSRFGMNEAQMTERVLKALDDPHLTVLGHPTGRLLLTREPYPIDMNAVIEKAAECGVAIELNADPHRLDLDWRLCRAAKERGVPIEIGPDAHSIHGLENTEIGVGIARKGWLEASDVLNTRTADEILAFAARRRTSAAGTMAPAAP